jgi:hypothetical protein
MVHIFAGAIYNIFMMNPFQTDLQQLEKGLFNLVSTRQGVATVLNINFLPDLLYHIKNQLAPEEVLRLEEYHLQNYLVELSLSYTGSS